MDHLANVLEITGPQTLALLVSGTPYMNFSQGLHFPVLRDLEEGTL